jgi:hypothetical protein
LVKRVNFLVEPRHLRFWCLGAAQLFERLADGELSCFSHGKILIRQQRDFLTAIVAASGSTIVDVNQKALEE